MLNLVTSTGQHPNIQIITCTLHGTIVTALRHLKIVSENVFFLFQTHWQNRVCKQPDPCIHSKENTTKVLLFTGNISRFTRNSLWYINVWN